MNRLFDWNTFIHRRFLPLVLCIDDCNGKGCNMKEFNELGRIVYVQPVKPLKIRIPIFHTDVSNLAMSTDQVIQYPSKDSEKCSLMLRFAHPKST